MRTEIAAEALQTAVFVIPSRCNGRQNKTFLNKLAFCLGIVLILSERMVCSEPRAQDIQCYRPYGYGVGADAKNLAIDVTRRGRG